MSMARPPATALTLAHQIGSNSQRFAADSRRTGGQCWCDGMADKPSWQVPSTCSNESKFAAGTWRRAKFAACRQGLFLPISTRRANHTRLQLSPQRDSPTFLEPGTAPRAQRHRRCWNRRHYHRQDRFVLCFPGQLLWSSVWAAGFGVSRASGPTRCPEVSSASGCTDVSPPFLLIAKGPYSNTTSVRHTLAPHSC